MNRLLGNAVARVVPLAALLGACTPAGHPAGLPASAPAVPASGSPAAEPAAPDAAAAADAEVPPDGAAASPSAARGACAQVIIGLDLRCLPVGSSESAVNLFVGGQSDAIRNLVPPDVTPAFFIQPGVGWLRVTFDAPAEGVALAACRRTMDAWLPTAPRLAGSMQSGASVGACEPCAAPAARPADDAPIAPADPSAPAPVEPEPVVTTVPDVPPGPCTDDPTQCTVDLHAPAAGRSVVLAAEGATIRLGFDEFRAAAAEHGEREVLAFLDARPADEAEVRLDGPAGPTTNRWPFVVAALLDAGRARVHDDRAARDVASIVRETWNWVGCSGGCRQAGRQYRLRVPGDVFFRVTDLFEDSF